MHTPVMTDQVIYYLNCLPGRIYCDGTIGMGGHAKNILEVTSPDGMLLGIDMDSKALAVASERLAEFGDRAILVQGNYKDLPSILASNNLSEIDGVLLDLGVSSFQLDDGGRGFSFLRDEPLGMNFDIHGRRRASQIINQYPESRLADIIWKYGQERWARRIAGRIVAERKKTPIESTAHLVRIICSAVPRSKGKRRIHPATRTFQALRMEVNQELENLCQFLEVVWGCLKRGGRVCIISFHSLEDGLVKRRFRDQVKTHHGLSEHSMVEILTKKPLKPSLEEVRMNPRSRSARMRAAECH